MSIISVMRSLCLLFIALCWTGALAPVAIAHKVALKDGRIIQFEKYRATENFYTDSAGREVKVLLSDIDANRTKELNASDPEPLDLPGLLVPNQQPVNNANASQSLAELAKKMRTTAAAAKAKRVFTDDDVLHSSGSDGPPLLQSDSSDWRSIADQLSSTADSLSEMTPSQLQQSALGELASVQFPGRDDWAGRLENARNKVLEVFRDGIKNFIEYHETADGLKNVKGLWSKGEEDKYNEALKMAYRALSSMQSAQSKYDAVASEGRTMAQNWHPQ